MSVAKSEYNQNLKKFVDLLEKDPEEFMNLFTKSFIFSLADWKEVSELLKKFRSYLREVNEFSGQLNVVQAADFLQKNGKDRTATQRKQEVTDIDLNNDNKIAFGEYLLLHYKKMILEDYYKRTGEKCPHDLSRDGVGVVGVGAELLSELFHIPSSLPAELIAELDKFANMVREREATMKSLSETAAKGGVKGLTAKTELTALENEDPLPMRKQKITLDAAVRKAMKSGGGSAEQAFAERQKKEEEEKKRQAEDSKARLKARAALFGN